MTDGGAIPRARYAPSPTGRMHAGNARTALIAWVAARAARGAFVLRVEDLDRARVVQGAEAALLDDLTWLGLDWDEGPDKGGPFAPYRQSQRTRLYDAALVHLLATGRAFPCACSRAEVSRAASAPHAEDDAGPPSPGTCRGLPASQVETRARALGREPTIRFDGRGARVAFTDGMHGAIEPLGAGGVDDFVLRRADGVAAYQLAVVVDDAAMGMTDVVRGADLVLSTPRQIALYHALGLRPPRFAHVPLLLTRDGDRIAKRTRPAPIAELREHGVDPRVVVGRLAVSAGLCAAGVALTPRELLREFATPEALWTRLSSEPGLWD